MKRVLWAGCWCCWAGMAGIAQAGKLPPDLNGTGAWVVLKRGEFPVHVFEAAGKAPRAAVVFGSGDGGWNPFEGRVCAALAAAGVRVVGWDTRAYARKPYTAEVLQADLRTMAAWALPAEPDRPVVWGGYSSGAEQSVAAVGQGMDFQKLRGMLLIAPGGRGRYGMTLSDLMMVTPRGPGTFALADFAPRLAGVRVAQIHGEHDPLDATEWLETLAGAHRLWTYPNGWHRFNGGDAAFLKMIRQSLEWILSEAP